MANTKAMAAILIAVVISVFLYIFISAPVSPTSTTITSTTSNGHYLYCDDEYFYGGNPNEYTNIAYYTSISSTGVGAWYSTTQYPDLGGSSISYNNIIYYVGGYSKPNAVDYAPLSSTGVGVWTNTTNYPVEVMEQCCTSYNNYIYCIGGWGPDINDNRAEYNNVYYAPVSSTGVGTWSSTTNWVASGPLNNCFSYNSYIYTVSRGSVYYAPVSNTGVGAWTATESYPLVLEMSCSAANDYIYCIGGQTNNSFAFNATNSVYYTRILSDGSLDIWSNTTNYPISVVSLDDSSCISYNNYIYCVGGYSTNPDTTEGIFYNNSYYASISSTGVGAWSAGAAFPESKFNIDALKCVSSTP